MVFSTDAGESAEGESVLMGLEEVVDEVASRNISGFVMVMVEGSCLPVSHISLDAEEISQVAAVRLGWAGFDDICCPLPLE